MAPNTYTSYETSWADQWDPEPLYEYKTTNDKRNSGGSSKISGKVGETLDKTKGVASTGVKKVKAGASAGFHWIKDKYNKSKQKH